MLNNNIRVFYYSLQSMLHLEYSVYTQYTIFIITSLMWISYNDTSINLNQKKLNADEHTQ